MGPSYIFVSGQPMWDPFQAGGQIKVGAHLGYPCGAKIGAHIGRMLDPGRHAGWVSTTES